MAGMAEAAAAGTPETEGAEDAGPKPGLVKNILGKILGLNKFILIGIVAALVLALGAGGYFFLLKGHKDAVAEAPKTLFYDLPDMTVNLSASPDRPQYLRVKVTLEVDNSHVIDALKPVMPRVIDTFQTHLRELRVTDLEGSAGLFRLRDELTRRVNLAIAPNRVRAVLFRELVVQ
jgi:flagellar FliL protein